MKTVIKRKRLSDYTNIKQNRLELKNDYKRQEGILYNDNKAIHQ